MEEWDRRANCIREQSTMKTALGDDAVNQMGDLVTRPRAGARPGLFTASVRVPALPANRAYLRALRAAEMVAWDKATPSVVPLRCFGR